MKDLDLNKRNLRKFGITMAAALGLISLILLRKHNSAAAILPVISALFLLSAFTTPLALKFMYICWMKLAFVLSWVNTRLLLIIIFYLIFAPVSLVLRIFRVDLLGFRHDQDSYWFKKQKKHFEKKDYESQF